MDVFAAAPHGEVLKLLVEIAVLLVTARVFGEIAQRFGQPSVIGEILAGIMLGPSLISGTFPAVGRWLVPASPLEGHLLEAVSMLGALFLLLATGLETDRALIRRQARVAAGVAAGGLVLPLASGFLLGELLPDRLLAANGDRLVFSLFVATAMSISAIPVIAKVLIDLDLMRREVGQTIVASAMIDDTVGWILLAAVARLARGEQVVAATVLQAAASLFLFMVLSFTIGARLVARTLDLVADRGVSPERVLTLVVACMFLSAAVTHALGLEPVLGAFVMGILFGNLRRLPEEVRERVKAIALGVFAPIFLAVAGLKVDARSLLEPELAALALAVIVVATASKVIGAYAGARLIGGRDHWTALCYGAGLNARGAMGIIVATIGLSLGILTREMFSIIVVMAMVTSLMAPFALRWAVARQQAAVESESPSTGAVRDAGS